MLDPLAILSTGAVLPGGLGVFTEPTCPSPEPLLSDPSRTVPVRRMDLATLARWIQEPRLRRASPLALFLAQAAHQALANAAPIAPNRLGLVAALGTGSIRFTRQFYERALAKGRSQAAPAVFPETVYNAPVSHIASLLGIAEACYSIVGDETALPGALRIAQTWLARDTVDAILVLAGEELDSIALEAYDRFGWFRRGLVATEGAAAILVSRADGGTGPCVQPATVTRTFRTRAEATAAWREVIAAAPHPILLPANLAPGRVGESAAPDAPRLVPDHGFAFTASAAWSLLQAVGHRAQGGPCTLLVAGANAAVTALDLP